MWLDKCERRGWALDSNSQLRLGVNGPKDCVCPEGDLRLGLQTTFLPIHPNHLNITEKTLLSPNLITCLLMLSVLTWLSLKTSRNISMFLCFPLPCSSLIWPFLHENMVNMLISLHHLIFQTDQCPLSTDVTYLRNLITGSQKHHCLRMDVSSSPTQAILYVVGTLFSSVREMTGPCSTPCSYTLSWNCVPGSFLRNLLH